MSDPEIDYGGVESEEEEVISLGGYDDAAATIPDAAPLLSAEPGLAAATETSDTQPSHTAAQAAINISEKGLGIVGNTDWVRKESKNWGGIYYANIKTDETTWTVPVEVLAYESSQQKAPKSPTPPRVTQDPPQAGSLLERIEGQASSRDKDSASGRRDRRPERRRSPADIDPREDDFYRPTGAKNFPRERDQRGSGDQRDRAPRDRDGRADRGPSPPRNRRGRDRFPTDTLNTRREADTYRPGAPLSPPPVSRLEDRRPPSPRGRRSISPAGRRDGPSARLNSDQGGRFANDLPRGGRRSPPPPQGVRNASGPDRVWGRGQGGNQGPPRNRSRSPSPRPRQDKRAPPRAHQDLPRESDPRGDRRRDEGQGRYEDRGGAPRDDRNRNERALPPRIDRQREEDVRRQQNAIPPPLPAPESNIAQAYGNRRRQPEAQPASQRPLDRRQPDSPPPPPLRRRDDFPPDRREETRAPPPSADIDERRARVLRRLEEERRRSPPAPAPLPPPVEIRSGMMAVNPDRLRRVQEADELARRQPGMESTSRMDPPPRSSRDNGPPVAQGSRNMPPPLERGNPHAPASAPAGPRAAPKLSIPQNGPPAGPRTMRNTPNSARDDFGPPASAPLSGRRDPPRNAFAESGSRPLDSPSSAPTGPRRSASGYESYTPNRGPPASPDDSRRQGRFEDARRENTRPFDSAPDSRLEGEYRAQDTRNQGMRPGDDFDRPRRPSYNDGPRSAESERRFSDRMQIEPPPQPRQADFRYDDSARDRIGARQRDESYDLSRVEQQDVRVRLRDDESYSAPAVNGDRPAKRRRDDDAGQPELIDKLGNAFQPTQAIEIEDSPRAQTPPPPASLRGMPQPSGSSASLLSRIGEPAPSMSIARRAIFDDQARTEEMGKSIRGLASSQSARRDETERPAAGSGGRNLDLQQRVAAPEDDEAFDMDGRGEDRGSANRKRWPRKRRGRGR